MTEHFSYQPSTPDQYVTEILLQVLDDWKQGLLGHLNEDSPLMNNFEKGTWGKQPLLRPVAKLGDDEAMPMWKTCPVPNCHYSQDINWL